MDWMMNKLILSSASFHQRIHEWARTFQVRSNDITASASWLYPSVQHRSQTFPSLQGKTPSGLSSPSQQTRTPTATASSTWSGRGTASSSASSCATRSDTRSTWATLWPVSLVLKSKPHSGLHFSSYWSAGLYFTAQANSTTSAISPASARTTVSSLIRSWMEEQAGSSEPTSSHPDLVNTWFHALLAGVSEIFSQLWLFWEWKVSEVSEYQLAVRFFAGLNQWFHVFVSFMTQTFQQTSEMRINILDLGQMETEFKLLSFKTRSCSQSEMKFVHTVLWLVVPDLTPDFHLI